MHTHMNAQKPKKRKTRGTAAAGTRPAAGSRAARPRRPAASPEPVGRATLADEAYRRIRDMILNLELFPGQTILLGDLAAQLGVSRTPVRQAVERLSSGMEGLLQMVPRKGIMVSFPDAEDMREIYEIMQGLEGQAVRLTLKRLDGDGLTALQTAISLQQDALTAGDRIAWAEADRGFHAALIEAAGNRRLRELVGLFRDQLNQTRVATLYLRGIESLQESTSEHRELVEALRARELDRALRIHNRHRERTISELPAIVQHSVRMMMQARIGAART